jgi:hypothetical protein
MTLHPCLPQTLTKELLASWIADNSKNSFSHEEHVKLTELEIQEFEHKSSAASRALDRLKAVEDDFKYHLKKGTPVLDGVAQPYETVIPPTKGSDQLKANREFADKILEQGYQVVTTPLYTIPYPEESTMVVVTIEGDEWPMYTKPMSKDQKALYGELFTGMPKKGKKGSFLGENIHFKGTTNEGGKDVAHFEIEDKDPLGLDL